MVRNGNLAKFQNSETGEATPTNVGVHAHLLP